LALLAFASLAFPPFDGVLVVPDVAPELAEVDSVVADVVDDVDELSDVAGLAVGSLAPSPAAVPDRESVR
jgi:hypothetical protein